jgi:hypothetical protein
MMELMTSRVITPEGFLQAPATLARTGIQLYRAREFGLDASGMDPDRIVRLHRPHEEVFNPESMASFENKPVIMGPHQTVTADNWSKIAIGDVHGIHCNGSLLGAQQMVIRDKAAIDDIQNGKKFLSNGYTFDLDLTPGTTGDGEAYDGVQRNIRGNHVAIVDSPRGGSACRIADSDEVPNKEKLMKKITINGVPVEVGDSEAGIIETLIAERDAARNQQPSITLKVGDSSKTVTGSEAIIKELQAKDSEIAELRKQIPTEEQLAQRVNQRVAVIGDASRLVEGFKADGKKDVDIMREVITAVAGKDAAVKGIADAVLGGKAAGDADEPVVAMAFKAVVAAAGNVAATTHQERSAGDAAMAAALVKDKQGADAKPAAGSMTFFQNMSSGFQKK